MYSRPEQANGSGVRRAPILFAVVAALLVGGLLDRIGATAQGPQASLVEPAPVAAPSTALSSSWFCAGATDNGTGDHPVDAPGQVVIANSGQAPVSGDVTLVPVDGADRTVPVTIGADSSAVVNESVPGGAQWIGSIVDIDAGGVAVAQVIDSSLGKVSAPCATAGSSTWYFATGFTLVNAGVELSLLNPYPSDSVVDLSFTTDQGLEAPEDFQGLVVPARGMLSVNLGSHLRRRHFIAITVAARTGRVVAWKTDYVLAPGAGSVLVGTPAAANPLADPAWPQMGLTVTLGTPSAATTWTWPDGIAGDGADEQYDIYNPGPATAYVRLSLRLAQGQAEPFDLAVGPYQVMPVISDQQARIPSGVPHSAQLRSLNGVPVVAERWISGTGPTGWQGIGELLGGRIPADGWLVPVTQIDPDHASYVILYNPGVAPVQVKIEALAGGQQVPLNGLAPTVVGPGLRVALYLNQYEAAPGAALVVSATGPIYVESDSYGKNGTAGVSLSFGVPMTG
jgi:hypothetical protein